LRPRTAFRITIKISRSTSGSSKVQLVSAGNLAVIAVNCLLSLPPITDQYTKEEPRASKAKTMMYAGLIELKIDLVKFREHYDMVVQVAVMLPSSMKRYSGILKHSTCHSSQVLTILLIRVRNIMVHSGSMFGSRTSCSSTQSSSSYLLHRHPLNRNTCRRPPDPSHQDPLAVNELYSIRY
jgi:hypothetical protein